MKNVMVFSCGAIPAMDINLAFRGNTEYRVYGASSYEDHGIYFFDNYIPNVPFLFEEDFIPKFNAILEKYKIDFIIPLHEDMILFFQEHLSEINAIVISSCLETALLCRYKSRTYDALKEFDFIPRTYRIDEVDKFPIFVKKDNDQGARHAYRVDTAEELSVYAKQKDMIICEYLPGEEVTVDCFTDRHGKLRIINPRVADRMLAGIDVHARRLSENSEITHIAKCINSKVKFRGPWFFQIKKAVNGKYKLLEISSRFAGAFGLTRCLDLNTPLLAVKDFEDKDIDVDFNDYPIEADKMFIGRYKVPVNYTNVVIDGMETFLINSKVDTFFTMFIHQCINEEKNIFIITKNQTETLDSLSKHGFNTIYFKCVADTGFTEKNYIFISRDEARRANERRKGVYCFSPTVIEVLMNWRG